MSFDVFAMDLIIENKYPSAEILKPAFADANDKDRSTDTQYKIEKENLNDKYFWLHARYGKSIPYSNIVMDANSQEEGDNPRKENEIELNKQLFVLYCINERILYISNKGQRKWLVEYLKNRLQKSIVISNIYKDAEEFIAKIKSVKEIKLVVQSKLFDENDLFIKPQKFLKVFSMPRDIFALDGPSDLTLEAKYTQAPVTQRFSDRFKELVTLQKSTDVKSLICVGRDDENLESIFNADGFAQKISIKATKDKHGFYNPKIVRVELIKKHEEVSGEKNS
ncbi:MAG: hypothetical protein ACR2PY_07105 [Salinispira sp.]